MLTKLLRFPIPDQIKALLEKIDSEGAALDSSSRRKIESLIHVDNLTRYERYLLKQGLAKYERAKTLDKAMCIVLNEPDEQEKIERAYQKNFAVGVQNTANLIRGATITGAQITGYPTDPRAIYQSAENYK
jgi:hypothetical protein